MKFDAADIIKSADRWLAKSHNRELFYDSARASISEAMAQISDRSAAKIGTALGDLGIWHANNAIQRLGTGDFAGWEDLICGFNARHWHDRILMGLTDLDARHNKRPRILPDAAVLTLLSTIAFDKVERSRKLGANCGRWLLTTKLWDLAFWRDTTLQNGLPAFAISLARIRNGEMPSNAIVGLPPLGHYADAIVAWNEGFELDGAILKMCDYHVARIAETEDVVPEFAWAPYNIVPIEYLALREVRQELGLSTPKPSHVLLDTEFADPPDRLPEVHDELLDHAIAAVREVIPDL